MKQFRLSNRVQLALGIILPMVLISGVILGSVRLKAKKERNEYNLTYEAITNVVIGLIPNARDLRIVQAPGLQHESAGGKNFCSGWYELGPDYERKWFRVRIEKTGEGKPPRASDVRFFDQRPPPHLDDPQ